MERNFEDASAGNANPASPGLDQVAANESRREDDPKVVRPRDGASSNYRLWRCNGVSIALHFHKKEK